MTADDKTRQVGGAPVMTVAGLIDRLVALAGRVPHNTPVILQRDAEGNAYSPATDLWVGRYLPTHTYMGEAYEDDYAPEEEDTVRAVMLVPTN